MSSSFQFTGCLYSAHFPKETTMPIILQVSKLVKRFAKLTAVNDVSFEIHTGSCLAYWGLMVPAKLRRLS